MKIELWAAMDENGQCFFYWHKPVRDYTMGMWVDMDAPNTCGPLDLGDELGLRWNGEPKKITLTMED